MEGPKLYGTFVALTHLVGALGFAAAVATLSRHRLRLVDGGVRIAATSNTLPGCRWGRGGSPAPTSIARSRVCRVTSRRCASTARTTGTAGCPPRYRPSLTTRWRSGRRRTRRRRTTASRACCKHLPRIHPSHYGALFEGVGLACIERTVPVVDQGAALRLVVLVDRLYDRDVPVLISGVPLDDLFPTELLAGGHRKKYLRAASRLTALMRQVSAS